jgi:voltage-gated potassium channel
LPRQSTFAFANSSQGDTPTSSTNGSLDSPHLTREAATARRLAWTTRLERWTDRPLTMLAVLLVPLLLAPFLFEFSAATDAAILDVDYVIWGIFAVTLAAAVIVTPDRRGYLRRHWLDFLLVVTPILTPLHAARALRLLWAASAAGRVLEGGRRLFVRRGTGFVLLGASLVVAVAAGLIVAVERDDPSATIRSYGDGLWWAMTTFATVGYGDKYPVTAAGRGIAVALMLLGIAAFGVVTANLAALFVEEKEDEAKAHLQQLDERLGRIEAVLRRPRRNPTAMAQMRRRVRKATNARNRIQRRARREQQDDTASGHQRKAGHERGSVAARNSGS